MQHDAHAHHGSAHDNHADEVHFTLKGYLGGFVIAAAMTAISFWLVMTHAIANTGAAAGVLVGLAIAQILVHTFAFLHVNARAQGGWILVAYAFTGVIVLITIGGSLWIMHHLNVNLMPGMTDGPDSGM
jgi:cytochrome o ubiquinol oxidase operon protein cyoD